MYPLPSESIIAGMCTGLLAGSAVSSAQSVSELLPVAVEAVMIAFRTGLRTTEIRDRIEQSSNASLSWSVVVPGMQEQSASAALKLFCEAKVGAVVHHRFDRINQSRVFHRPRNHISVPLVHLV